MAIVRVPAFIVSHPANRGRRIRALFAATRFQLRGRLLGRPTLVRIGRSTHMWAQLHQPASSKVAYANPPDWPEMVVWQRVLRPGDLFIDVGANVGSYSMFAADCGAEVIALEPDPKTFTLLQANAALARTHVQALCAAAAEQDGQGVLTIDKGPMNRLVRGGDSAPTGQSVNLVALDGVIGERWVAGMKVDVEGAERTVLQGCSRALAQHRIGLIQLEWNDRSSVALQEDRQPVARLLMSHGYELLEPRPDGSLHRTDNVGYGADRFARPAGGASRDG